MKKEGTMTRDPDKTAATFRLVNKGMKRMSDRIDKIESPKSDGESLDDLFKKFIELQNSRMVSEIRVDPELQAISLKEIDALRSTLRRYDLSRIDLDPRVRLKANAAKAYAAKA